jgi:hypothetical protein
MKISSIIVILGSLSLFAEDPSLKAKPSEGGPEKFLERTKIIADIDADGHQDMLLTIAPNDGGKMGEIWAVYLSRNASYIKVGEICAHSMAISIEPDQAIINKDETTRRYARIWVYLRGSGSAGSLGYYRVGEKSIDELESIEIYPGDGGTKIGNSISKAIFTESIIPFRRQVSKTDDAGVVTWLDADK